MPLISGVTVVKTRSEASALLDRVWRQGKAGEPAAVDTEFGRDDSGKEFVTVWSLSTGKGDRNCIYADPGLNVFKDWIEDEKAPKVYHTYVADADSMADSGVVPQGLYADIWVMSSLVDSYDRRHDLKYLEHKYLGTPIRPGFMQMFSYVPDGKKKEVLYTWPEIFASKDLRQKLYSYSADDAEGTIRVFKKLKYALNTDGWNYFETYRQIDVPFTLTLHAMMKRGFLVDRKMLQAQEVEFRVRLMRKLRVLRELVEWPDLNPNSNPQLQKLFFQQLDYPAIRKTASGWSTDADTLTKWSEAGLDIAQHLLDYRELESLRKTFITGVLLGLSPDGRLHSDLNQIGAGATGRISSRKIDKTIMVPHHKKDRKTGEVTTTYKAKKIKVGANLQNIPARSAEGNRIRKAFIAAPGHKLVIADLAGAEWWMMAHWSRDGEMADQYHNKKDPHAVTAKFFFNLKESWEEIKAGAKAGDPRMKMYRDNGKTGNFGFLYLCRARRAAQLLGRKDRYEKFIRADGRKGRRLVESAEQQGAGFLEKFFGLYKGVRQYHGSMIKFARDHGYVLTIAGRRCAMPWIMADDEGKREHEERRAVNAPIQGSIADIIKAAMNYFERSAFMKKRGAKMLIQVHDEIVFEVPEEYAEEVRVYVEKKMPLPFSDKMDVKLAAEAKVTSSWADK